MTKHVLSVYKYCFGIFVLIIFPSVIVASVKSEDNQSQQLIGEISAPSEIKIGRGWVDAKLIIKNVSKEPIRIPGLYFGITQYAKEQKYLAGFSPDWFPAKPEPNKILEKIVTLAPDDTFAIPFTISYSGIAKYFQGRSFTISSRYLISKEFAERYGIWSGEIVAKSITINVVE